MTKVMMVASRNTSDRDMNTCPMMVSARLYSSGIGCEYTHHYLTLLMHFRLTSDTPGLRRMAKCVRWLHEHSTDPFSKWVGKQSSALHEKVPSVKFILQKTNKINIIIYNNIMWFIIYCNHLKDTIEFIVFKWEWLMSGWLSLLVCVEKRTLSFVGFLNVEKWKEDGHILRQVAGTTAITWQSRGEERRNGSGERKSVRGRVNKRANSFSPLLFWKQWGKIPEIVWSNETFKGKRESYIKAKMLYY